MNSISLEFREALVLGWCLDRTSKAMAGYLFYFTAHALEGHYDVYWDTTPGKKLVKC